MTPARPGGRSAHISASALRLRAPRRGDLAGTGARRRRGRAGDPRALEHASADARRSLALAQWLRRLPMGGGGGVPQLSGGGIAACGGLTRAPILFAKKFYQKTLPSP